MKSKFIYYRWVFVLFICFYSKAYTQDNPYIGEIRMFAGNFVPVGWAECNGQLLSISENEVLYAIIGTTYGGDGRNTFALPDLRGRIPMGEGQKPGITPTVVGQIRGTETVTLLAANIPVHTHQLSVYNGPADLNSLTGSPYLALLQDAGLSPVSSFTTHSPNAVLNSGTVSPVGGNQSVNTIQPSLSVMFIISLYGVFPSQN